MAALFPAASRLGFGCASLGSRIAAREGLRALARAYEFGVNWYDLAPSYGDGEAESIVAQFARGRRSSIHICTKCGLAPGRVRTLAQLAKPLARSAVRVVPRLRDLVSRARTSAVAMPLSAALIADSINRSLKRLQTDHVDVYALHDPPADALEREDVQRALQDVLASGKARVIGVAGNFEAAVAALRSELAVTFVQMANPPFENVTCRLRTVAGPNRRQLLLSTHSVFGGSDVEALLATRAGSRARLLELLAAHGYPMPLDAALHAALLDHALARNRDGIVLVSMFSRDHLERNTSRLRPGAGARSEALFAALSSAATAGAAHG